jgi:plasmid stabilization system protein ParE
VADALVFTEEKFGPRQRHRYEELIEDALEVLRRTPSDGLRRPDIHPRAMTYHIGQRGKRARHLFVYRILKAEQRVQVACLLYDGCDMPRHWPQNWRR